MKFIVIQIRNTFYKIHLSKTDFHQTRKEFYKHNLLFAQLQFYKQICLNLFEDNVCCHKQEKNHSKNSHSTPSFETFKPQNLCKFYRHMFLI